MFSDIDYNYEYEKYLQHFRKLLNDRIRNDSRVTQAGLGRMMQKSQNAINNWLTENKKYQCVPNAIDFLILCRILNLEPGKFLDTSYTFQKYMHDPEYSAESLPFIETSVSRDIKKICNECYCGKKPCAVFTVSHNGAERAFREFVQCNRPYAVLLQNSESIPGIKQQINSSFQSAAAPCVENQKLLFLIMNAGQIDLAAKDALMKEFYPDHALLFIYHQETSDDAFLKRNINKFYLKSITKYDIMEILNTLFPGISSDAISLMEALSKGRINIIMEMTGKIRNVYRDRRKISKKDILDIIF